MLIKVDSRQLGETPMLAWLLRFHGEQGTLVASGEIQHEAPLVCFRLLQ